MENLSCIAIRNKSFGSGDMEKDYLGDVKQYDMRPLAYRRYHCQPATKMKGRS